MKIIIAILVVTVILHEISLYRLDRKVTALQVFFDGVVKQLEIIRCKQTERNSE